MRKTQSKPSKRGLSVLQWLQEGKDGLFRCASPPAFCWHCRRRWPGLPACLLLVWSACRGPCAHRPTRVQRQPRPPAAARPRRPTEQSWEDRPSALVPVRTVWVGPQGRRQGGFKLLTLRKRILDTELVD